jgi:hypothetical protein
VFGAGDTAGSLELVVTRRGIAVDVTEAVVTATIEREGQEPIVDRAAVIVNGPEGLVRVDWQAGDLEAVTVDETHEEPADYALELTVDGTTQPVPTRFTVRPALA